MKKMLIDSNVPWIETAAPTLPGEIYLNSITLSGGKLKQLASDDLAFVLFHEREGSASDMAEVARKLCRPAASHATTENDYAAASAILENARNKRSKREG